jgi:hypothetical protein
MADLSRHLEFTADSGFEVMRRGYNAMIENRLNELVSIPQLQAAAAPANVRSNIAADYVRLGLRRAQLAAGDITMTVASSMPDDGGIRERVILVTIGPADSYVLTVGAISTAGAGTAVIPDIPSGHVLLGHVRVRAAGGTAFVGGTTSLAAAGITTTYTPLNAPVWLLDRVFRLERS